MGTLILFVVIVALPAALLVFSTRAHTRSLLRLHLVLAMIAWMYASSLAVVFRIGLSMMHGPFEDSFALVAWLAVLVCGTYFWVTALRALRLAASKTGRIVWVIALLVAHLAVQFLMPLAWLLVVAFTITAAVKLPPEPEPVPTPQG